MVATAMSLRSASLCKDVSPGTHTCTPQPRLATPPGWTADQGMLEHGGMPNQAGGCLRQHAAREEPALHGVDGCSRGGHAMPQNEPR